MGKRKHVAGKSEDNASKEHCTVCWRTFSVVLKKVNNSIIINCWNVHVFVSLKNMHRIMHQVWVKSFKNHFTHREKGREGVNTIGSAGSATLVDATGVNRAHAPLLQCCKRQHALHMNKRRTETHKHRHTKPPHHSVIGIRVPIT